MAPKIQPLDPYHNLLKKHKTPFLCPGCSQLVLAKDFEKHAKDCLHLDPSTQCVWCRKVYWPRRQKRHFAKHLCGCFKRCTFRIPPPPLPSTRFPYTPMISNSSEPQDYSNIQLLPTETTTDAAAAEQDAFGLIQKTFILDNVQDLLAPEKDFFEQPKLPNLPDLAYKPFAVRHFNLNSLPVTFQNKNLNLAAASVQLFLQLQDTHDFFHCMVRAVVISQFIDAMLADFPQSFMIPFFCYCCGGAEQWTENRHWHHRHMIIASPKNHFQEHVWKKIKIRPEDRPRNKDGKLITGFHPIFKTPIETPLHFVNALVYLCKRESLCNGNTVDEKQSYRKTHHLNHYYNYKSLPIHCKLYLTALWDGGLLQLVRQTYQHLPPKHLVRVARFVEGRWRIQIQDIYNIELHRVLAVAKHFKPTPEPTEHYLHLLNGEKLFFERDETLLTLNEEEWGRLQAENGHVFYSAVGNEYWTPGKFQQKCLNAIEDYESERRLDTTNLLQNPFDYLNNTLQTNDFERQFQVEREDRDVQRFNSQITALQKELESACTEKERFRKEMERLQKELEATRTEMARLKAQLDIRNNEYIESLKQLLDAAHADNERLKQQLDTAHADNERLKQQLDTANAENERLKQQLSLQQTLRMSD